MDQQGRSGAQTIAVINREDAYRSLLGEVLSQAGYQPLLFTDGAAAHAEIRSRQPALILLDIAAGSLEDGWSALEMLRLDPATSAIPTVICSRDSRALSAQRPRLEQKRCVLLERPFDREDLLHALRSAVNGGATKQATAPAQQSAPKPAAPAAQAAHQPHPQQRQAPTEAQQQQRKKHSDAISAMEADTQRQSTSKNYYKAIEAMQRGDRDTAYWLMRQAIVEDPGYLPGWLRMAGLVDNVEQQRECLERALSIDPNCAPAREALEILNLKQMVHEQPPIPEEERPHRREMRKLGAYLVEQGFITAAQLDQALLEQRTTQNRRGDHIPLGDIFLQHGWLTPQSLAKALVAQQQDKLTGNSPQHLGEYLVKRGVLTADQLARVLAQQAGLRQVGERILLGDLLVRGGYVTADMLDHVLEEQRDDFFKRFWDG